MPGADRSGGDRPHSGARYQPYERSGSNGARSDRKNLSRVYVENLSRLTTWQDLKDHMRAVGTVLRVEVFMSADSRSRNGVVEYGCPEDAQKAIDTLNESRLRGHLIRVCQHRDQEQDQASAGRSSTSRQDDYRGDTSLPRRDDYRGDMSRRDDYNSDMSRRDDYNSDMSRREDYRGDTSRRDDYRGDSSRREDYRGDTFRREDYRGDSSHQDDFRGMSSNLSLPNDFRGMSSNMSLPNDLRGMSSNMPLPNNFQASGSNLSLPNDFRGMSSNMSLPNNFQSSGFKMSLPNNFQSSGSNMSLPNDFRGMSSNMSLPNNFQSSSSNMSLQDDLRGMSSNMSLPNNFQASSSNMSLPNDFRGMSSNMSLPNNFQASGSNMSLPNNFQSSGSNMSLPNDFHASSSNLALQNNLLGMNSNMSSHMALGNDLRGMSSMISLPNNLLGMSSNLSVPNDFQLGYSSYPGQSRGSDPRPGPSFSENNFMSKYSSGQTDPFASSGILPHTMASSMPLTGMPQLQAPDPSTIFGTGPSRQVYVKNLPFKMSWQHLKDLFRKFGSVVRAELHRDSEGKSKGAGVVMFVTPEEAQAAVAGLNGSEYEGRVLQAHLEQPLLGFRPQNAPAVTRVYTS